MTAIATMLMNPQTVQGSKMGNSNPKASSSEGAFSEIVAGVLGNQSTSESIGLNSEQLLGLLEDFRKELKEEYGVDVSLQELIKQLQSQISDLQQVQQPFLKNLMKTMPILEPIQQKTGQPFETAQLEQTPGSDQQVKEFLKQMDAQLSKVNVKQENSIHQFVKFLMKNEHMNTAPPLQNLKQMMRELQAKLAEQSTSSPVAEKTAQTLTQTNSRTSFLFHMKDVMVSSGQNNGIESTPKLRQPEISTSGLFSVASPTIMSKSEQFILHAPQENTPGSRFVNDLAAIMNRGRIMTLPNGATQLTIKLFPENLGSLDIQIIQRNGEIAAKIIASTAQAKDLIESNLHQLRHSLQGLSINIDKIEITNHTPDWMNDKHERGDQKQDAQHDQDQLQQQNEDENQDSFEQLLREMGIDEEV